MPTSKLPKSLDWIPNNWNWSKLKPVIRCAVVGWVSALLFIIPKVEIDMGQASFLILIAAFLSPPCDPFLAVLEREFLILLLVMMAWAWSCLGIFFANLARSHHDPTVTITEAVSGEYLEPASTVIIAVFAFFGGAFILYIKAVKGPGPYMFPTVFACICLDISLTTAVLFPFPYYMIGKAIIVPLCLYSATALLGSVLIFPSTISAQFTTRLQLVLNPLISMLDLHQKILHLDINSDEFKKLASSITSTVNQSEAALIPLAASCRFLSSDVIYARFAPNDFRPFQTFCMKVAGRANGMGLYFTLADTSIRDKTPIMRSHSIRNASGPSTPVISRATSPGENLVSNDERENHLEQERGTIEGSEIGLRLPATNTSDGNKISPQSEDTISIEGGEDSSPPVSPVSLRHHKASSRKKSRSRSTTRRVGSPVDHQPHTHLRPHSHLHYLHHHHSHHSLLHLSLGRQYKEFAVGVFELQRYMDMEATKVHDPLAPIYSQRMLGLLQECCTPLLGATKEGLVGIRDWLDTVRASRINFWVSSEVKEERRQTKLDAIQRLRYHVAKSLEEFRNNKRLKVLDLYRPAFEKLEETQDFVLPPHQYLFHCYVYQYHFIRLSETIVDMLDEIIKLEVKRDRLRLWTPMEKLSMWNKWNIAEDTENAEDDDPDVIQGAQPTTLNDLDVPRRRDPDALPPRNAFEWLMSVLYYACTALAHGNALFALKAGLFTVVLCLPCFLKSSARFAYTNHFVWSIFMGQLTLARFRGDTTFGLTARIASTFCGGIMGIIMWYVSCGSGNGNPYGLAAVCGVCFPFFYFARVYWPGPLMTNFVFFVTACLVIGYSYQDLHILSPGSPGYGFSVAWRRFVLVTIGVAAAFIISFLPPSTTIRRYQRRLLSTTCTELGAIYCSILSFANARNAKEVQEIITSLIALRSKLKRSVVLRTNVIYEFSLRGRWPAKRYHKIMELQLEIAYSLSHLMSVLEHLEPAWTKAFLTRTRFNDADFQGDILAVITMIASSLRTGDPLPQITPTPLINRFMKTNHGFDVILKESQEDYGLPRALTIDALQNEQYMMFCVGVSTAFNIVNRLDRLMIAAKDIVGEQYHIHGLGISRSMSNMGMMMSDLGHAMSQAEVRPSRDV